MRNLVLGSGMIFFCFGLMFQGVLKDGVTTWIPTYIREEYHMESVISIISTTIIPVFNLSGVYMASIANRKVFKSEITTSASFFALCAGALVLLRLYQGGSVWLGWDATILIWIIIAVLGAWVCTAGIARWKRFLQYGI